MKIHYRFMCADCDALMIYSLGFYYSVKTHKHGMQQKYLPDSVSCPECGKTRFFRDGKQTYYKSGKWHEFD